MNSPRYSPEFKDEAVRQVLERGYSVTEVSERLGVSAHSLYKWVKAVKPDKSDELDEELKEAKREILKLRAELRRAEEDRVLIHSDQGSQYSSDDWLRFCTQHNLEPRMSRRHSHLGGVSPEAFEAASF